MVTERAARIVTNGIDGMHPLPMGTPLPSQVIIPAADLALTPEDMRLVTLIAALQVRGYVLRPERGSSCQLPYERIRGTWVDLLVLDVERDSIAHRFAASEFKPGAAPTPERSVEGSMEDVLRAVLTWPTY